WVAAENKVTFDYLGRLAMRDRLKQRITELWDFPKVSVPAREGGRYFYRKNSGLQRQSVLYVQANLQAEPSVVLDPNTLSPDGSLSLSDWKASPDGKLVVYGVSEGGADWETLHVRKVDGQKDSEEQLRWVRFADLGDPQRPNITSPVKALIEQDDAEFAVFGNVGPLLYMRTDLDAPNRKVVTFDVKRPEAAAWKTIVPEGKEAIEEVHLIGGRI